MEEERGDSDLANKRRVDEFVAPLASAPASAPAPAPAPATSTEDKGSDSGDDGFDMFADSPTLDTTNATKASTKTSSAGATDSKLADNWDDPEGYYKTLPGDVIIGRYQVVSFLGRGVFASVVRAR